MDLVRKELDFHFSNYDNILLLGDLSSEITDSSLKDYCELYSLQKLIKKSLQKLIKKLHCFKNPGKPKTIGLILTNRPKSFCNSDTI